MNKTPRDKMERPASLEQCAVNGGISHDTAFSARRVKRERKTHEVGSTRFRESTSGARDALCSSTVHHYSVCRAFLVGLLIVFGGNCDHVRVLPAQSKDKQKKVSKSEQQAGTILRVGCGAETATGHVFHGRVEWSFGSESFSFALQAPFAIVRLRQSVPSDQFITIRLFVDQPPPLPTKFTRGEWITRCRPDSPDAESGVNVLTVQLSALHNLESTAKVLMVPP